VGLAASLVFLPPVSLYFITKNVYNILRKQMEVAFSVEVIDIINE